MEDFADAMVEFRRRQQMDMVGHPDIGMDRQTMLRCRFHQGIAKKLIICISGKDHLPVVATLDNVLWLARDDVAGKAGHSGSYQGINALA